jgi:hypothetical protein
MPVNIQLSKIDRYFPDDSRSQPLVPESLTSELIRPPFRPSGAACLVGLGRIELPTSPLSGVRSSHLSYRPGPPATPGGAGRDRTGDLLNANQALSQLSYSPFCEKSIEASWTPEDHEPRP